MCEPRYLAEATLAVKRHSDVEPLGTRCFHPACEAQLVEEAAKRECCRTQDIRLIFRRVEVEDADVGLVQVGRARRPHVRRDAVLVGEPEQRSRVAYEWMVHRPALL